MFWFFCAILTLAVAAAIAAPLRRGKAFDATPAAAYDLRVYRDQLREVERDLERGVIGADEAERLRAEIGRKVLEADRRLADAAGSGRGSSALAALVVLLVLLASALALYLREGVPGAPDLPVAARIAAAERAYAERPDQAEAEARSSSLPALPAPPLDPDYLALVEKLRVAVRENPDDPRGLALLATSEMRLNNMVAARQAQQRLVDLRGPAASADELMRLSAMMMEAAGGLITPEAEQALARSLQKDPSQPQARYLLGMLQLQNGRPDRAFTLWSRLLDENHGDAPWIAPIRSAIMDLAWLAGQPNYTPPPETAPGLTAPMAGLPGPDQDAVDAAGDLSADERQEMIAGMVGRLEDRLAEEGGTPEEWARLISSLAILGNSDHARDIWANAQQVFASQPEALEMIGNAAAQAGVAQ